MREPVEQPLSPLEILRRLDNIVRVGTVLALDAQAARCRVASGGITTDWLPWLTHRAGGTDNGATWWAPSLGEQCLLLCPGGDTARGFVLPGIYTDTNPAPHDSLVAHRVRWCEGNQFTHSRATGSAEMEVTGHITITAGQSITLRVGNSALVITADTITAAPDILGDGRVSLVTHLHGGVESGGSTTSGPV